MIKSLEKVKTKFSFEIYKSLADLNDDINNSINIL
jgi:hypothetical protein